LTNYSRNGKTASKSDSSKSKPKKTKKAKRFSKKDDARKSYRFLTPTERLAESLPSTLRDWFLRNDKNGDGQIAMSEFATLWSREKAVDFASYDLNNDGVITPQEFLRVKTGVVVKN
jgi:Ca2+-binding EF-hand superfamily protein